MTRSTWAGRALVPFGVWSASQGSTPDSKMSNLAKMLNTAMITSILLLGTVPQGVRSGPNERRLINDLLEKYNNLERPVYNESEALKLAFGLTLQQIIDVDEKNQILTTNIWLNLDWKDVNMVWNKSEYGNIEDIRMPPQKLWKPDVLMYNSADEAFDGTYQTNVVVNSNGSCTYIPPGIFKSTCKIDITWFPFDDQDCEMKFGSWTYNGFKLDLQLNGEEGDTSTYVMNGEWSLLGVPGQRNEVFYDCCPEPYLDVTFTIKIRRRTLYYFFNLIVPCVLIASMAVLGFTLPPDSGEKLSLGVTILLSLTVFLNMVSATMPVTSDNPLLGTYFNCIMFMVASSVVTTIMILNYHHRLADTHEMPNWVRCVFLQWIPWMLRMGRPGEKITRKTIMMQNKMKELDLKERSSKSLLANVLDMDDDFRPSSTLPHSHIHPHHPSHTHPAGPMGPMGNTPTPGSGGFMRVTSGLPPSSTDDGMVGGNGTVGGGVGSSLNSFPPGVHRELSLILKELRVITDKIRDDEDTAAIENDWKFAAMVLDRLCLIIFTFFTIAATIAVLLSAPHIIVT
ncbi:neuronal acetylcholine receptor subunit alpha-7-like isoform X10 [Tigriopus californicus]|uniref:neuronal acetylcholine receptor subunit alpha-7-like isoform X10 n=1 Tax=Tigriopus californicus TaxID=6832 RepID=UPI0027DAAFBD|nr:neuronal acetylcholine receptor subunit alpha-7-like isoform X10 [Tigriopus californicus]